MSEIVSVKIIYYLGGAVGPSKGRPSKKTRALPVDRVGGRTENVIGSPPLGDHTRGQKKTRPKKKKALLGKL